MSDIAAASSSLPVARPRAAASAGFAMPFDLSSARALLRQPAVTRALPWLGLIAVIAAMLLAWSLVAGPAMREIAPDASEADRAAMLTALEGGGIAAEVDSGSGALVVPDADYHHARLLLAEQGLPSEAESGSAMLASLPTGASRAIENDRLRAAREADLARTIEAIDAVASARVMLAAADPSPFVRQSAPVSASVMLTLHPGQTLAPGQVEAIVNLVSTAVSGLSAENVAIIDGAGRLLSQRDAMSATAQRQLDVQEAHEQRYLVALTRLLTPIVGADNYTAEVHLDMDFSEVQMSRDGFPETPGVLRSEQSETSSDGSSAPVGGIPGALSNVPPPAATVTTDPAATAQIGTTAAGPGRSSQNVSRNFAIGRETSVTRQQSPTVRRVSVAVALRNPATGRPRAVAELREIERLASGALGIDRARGDSIIVSARKFTPVATTTTPWWQAEWLSALIRPLLALVAVLAILLLVARPLLRRAMAAWDRGPEVLPPAAQPQLSHDIASEVGRSDADTGSASVTLEMIQATADYDARAALVRRFVQQDPARAALVVRDLIRAEAGEKAHV